MDRMIEWAVGALMLVFVVVPAVMAQTTPSTATPSWIESIAGAGSQLLPVLIPVIVLGFRKWFDALSPRALPIVSVLVGAGLDALTSVVQGGTPTRYGVLCGLAATGLHQVKKQLYDKQS